MSQLKIKSILVASLLATSLACFAGSGSSNWNYDDASNMGPSHWGDYFQNCRPGGFQSPINIMPRDVVGHDESSLALHFQAINTMVKNNGHALEMTVLNSAKNFVTWNNLPYKLQECHFHVTSENSLFGKKYPADMHCVTQNDKGQYVVLAVMFVGGQANAGFSDFWSLLNKKHTSLSQNVWPNLFPQNLAYYTFEGSLTTPACDRGITWVMFKNPVEISREQIAQLQKFGPNARPLQAVNGRNILTGVAHES